MSKGFIIGNVYHEVKTEIKSFAVITVNYSEGSTCTCTDGNKTFELEDSSGCGFFVIPYAGTWTVTATDGTNTKSAAVEITAEGQVESVELTYGLILFNAADECTALTGGWEAIGKEQPNGGWAGKAPTVTKNTDSYEISFAASYGGIFATANKIDLSEYSTLKVLLCTNIELASDYSCIFGVFDSSSLTMNGMQNAIASRNMATVSPDVEVELTLDVTNVTEGNVGFAHYTDRNYIIKNLWKVWAVK